ncbi:MAG: S8 family serine peptidase [Bdellovibrionaceae bacterium]|nr:S8 family serine peptidase [Bdellovibrio sp.]
MGWILSLLLTASISNAGEFLVKYKNTAALNKMASMQTQAVGLQMKSINKTAHLVKVFIEKKNEARAIASLYADKNVEYVVTNFKIRSYTNPATITALKEQYSLAKVNAEAAWKRAGNKGSRKVILAVIDTGVDYNHPNLAPNTVPGFDFKDNDADPMDATGSANPGHGTHCAGIVGATGLIDGGVQGMSPEVSIMPLRFLGADGSGDLESAIKAIDYAIEKKVSVISASWGASVPPDTAKPLIEAVERADKAGIIFVTAAANDGKNNDKVNVYPANSGTPNMLTIAASNSTDAKPSWSNYGKGKVSIAAPGDEIISTLPGNKYENLSGTSMATPMVAGLVAFLKAQDATLTGAEIRSLMQVTGAKVQIETACNCRIDAFAAVDTLLSKKAWIVPAAASIAEKATVQLAMKNASGAVSFVSSNPAVATIDAAGLVTGLTQGTVTVKATDAAGTAVQSLDINVGAVASNPPPGGGGPGGGGGGECPLGDPALCQIMCQIMPTAPWCK